MRRAGGVISLEEIGAYSGEETTAAAAAAQGGESNPHRLRNRVILSVQMALRLPINANQIFS
jgi:hypothetical protein